MVTQRTQANRLARKFLSVDLVAVVSDRVFWIHTPSLQALVGDKSFRQGLRTRYQCAIEINLRSDSPSTVLRPEEIRRLRHEAVLCQSPAKLPSCVQGTFE